MYGNFFSVLTELHRSCRMFDRRNRSYTDGSEAAEERAAEGAEDDQRRRSADADRNNERAVWRRTEADDEHLSEDYSDTATRLRLSIL